MITIFIVGGLRLGVVAVFVLGVFSARFFKEEVVERATGPLVTSNCFAFCSKSFSIGSSLNFNNGKKRRKLSVVESEQEARDKNSLTGGVNEIRMSFEHEETRSVQVHRNCFVARLEETCEGVEICRGNIRFFKYLDELFPEW